MYTLTFTLEGGHIYHGNSKLQQLYSTSFAFSNFQVYEEQNNIPLRVEDIAGL